ncbi:hypothetical protein BT63DRAFT_416106 [Microthyrium microscopicum]|uniref:Swiss Army Knife RNA repair protein HAD domain-containing protein n=1 Tax=Microthyrium microscopicum TaxID=703497 RepID=A0A6A6U6V7_9PEZI|nr:hypothetical protein BT63DRAFT_416106 [Microthyrium microscopicum]
MASFVSTLVSPKPGTEAYSLNALKRWGCNDPTLPPINQIKELHVYDFDNTIFMTPLPNRSIWESTLANRLQNEDVFLNGGWWHDPGILTATGEGIAVEEPRAWEGYWNEKVVELIRLSMEQPDALTVLLTGRGEERFSDLVQRICKSRKLVFDLYCLKPVTGPLGEKFSTMKFKQAFLTSLMNTYREAQSIRVYDDRIRHVQEFREFLEDFNQDIAQGVTTIRPRINAEVLEVIQLPGTLDPVMETAEVQKMINNHNSAIRNGTAPPGTKPQKLDKRVILTAYLVKSTSASDRLLGMVPIPEAARRMANSVIITTYPAPKEVLDRVGGLGARCRFKVISLGSYNNRIWAARLEAIGQSAYSSLGHLQMVLAMDKRAKATEVRSIKNWKPVLPHNMYEFDTVVGEVFRLTFGEDFGPDGPTQVDDSRNQPPPHKRRTLTHVGQNSNRMDVDHPPPQQSGQRGGFRGKPHAPRGNRGGRGGFQPRGGSNHRARGRGYSTGPPRPPHYTDYDAQGQGRDKDASMYANY